MFPFSPAAPTTGRPPIVNRPFTTGDNLWADTDGQAELHLNNAVLRIGAQSSLGFLNLDDHFAQIRFTQGELFLRVRHLGDDDSFEVDTPNAAITILRDGEYRFNADPDAVDYLRGGPPRRGGSHRRRPGFHLARGQ